MTFHRLLQSQRHSQQPQLKVCALPPWPLVLIMITRRQTHNMEVSTILTFLVPAMLVTAAPAAADVDSATVRLETRDLTQGQCRRACDEGADAVQRFSRLIPELRVRAACLLAATAIESPSGQLACTSFCDACFSGTGHVQPGFVWIALPTSIGGGLSSA